MIFSCLGGCCDSLCSSEHILATRLKALGQRKSEFSQTLKDFSLNFFLPGLITWLVFKKPQNQNV